MTIYEITDARFKKYGKIVDGIDFSEMIDVMKKETPIPEGVVYEPGCEALESLPVYGELMNRMYGEMPIQIGYCNGHNELLNAVEYHRNSEINIAATDAILILGMQQDVDSKFHYDTSKMEAFFVPAGTAVEIYATTLHYAPCGVKGAGFQVGIVLPKGTNLALETKHTDGEDGLITAKNKWLIAHKDGNQGDVFIGLVGENLNVNK